MRIIDKRSGSIGDIWHTAMLSRAIYYIWTSFRKRAAYRADILFGWLGTIIMVVISYSVWRAVYAHTDQVGPFSFNQFVTYIIMAKMLEQLFEINVEESLGQILQTGDISILMVRPFQIPLVILMEGLSGIIFNLIFLVFPLFSVLLLIFRDIQLPFSINTILFFFISSALGWGVMFTLQFLIGLFGFYNVRLHALYRLRTGSLSLLGGVVIPLAVYPSWMVPIIFNLPIISIFHRPLSILIGMGNEEYSYLFNTLLSLHFSKVSAALLEQCVWLAVMVSVMWFCWLRIRNSLIVNGG